MTTEADYLAIGRTLYQGGNPRIVFAREYDLGRDRYVTAVKFEGRDWKCSEGIRVWFGDGGEEHITTLDHVMSVISPQERIKIESLEE